MAIAPPKTGNTIKPRGPQDLRRLGWLAAAILLYVTATFAAYHQSPRPDVWAKPQVGSLDWWRYPVERNAFERQPAITAIIIGITHIPGTNDLVIAGTNGSLARFDGQSRSWTPCTSGTSEWLHSVSFADAANGWTSGGNGTLLATADGGKTWTPQESGTTKQLNSVTFVDASHGWAAGYDGTLLATANGGRTWTTQESGTALHLFSVIFADTSHGWAGGVNGTLIATTDGGRTWAAQKSGTTNQLNSVIFADHHHGWAAGEHGTILATADGGRTWAAQKSGTTNQLNSVTFADDRHGWAAGERGTILATADGGRTWAAQKSGSTEGLYSVTFADATHGWAAGNATLIATADSGRTWTMSGISNVLYSVTFADAAHGWAAGNGTLFATADGGRTWTKSGTTNTLYSVTFADALHGWAAGDGTLVATADGGSTWTAQKSGITNALYSVTFTDASHGWAAGDNGTIIATVDGGRTWTVKQSGTLNTLLSITFADASHGWAAGSGTLIATADGGRTWTSQKRGTANALYSVTFADASHGWAAGYSGTIVTTSDGGRTWTSQKSGTTNALYSVTFADASHGWAAGNNGSLLATIDGGRTWTAQSCGCTEQLNSVKFTDTTHGVVVTLGGKILITTDGGRTWNPTYHRSPAPWLYLFILPIFLSLVPVLRKPETIKQPDSVADLLVSDRPLQAAIYDRLGFGEIAAGIARFLRNSKTEPPLTIAITGVWGSGKSSLMNLLCEELKRSGSSPVWFNAWHHQEEDQMLAALLANIREQATPNFWNKAGPIYYGRLFTLRIKRQWPAFLLFGALTAFTCGAYFQLHFTSKLITGSGIAVLITGITGLLATVRKTFAPFSDSPGKLLAAVRTGARIKDLDDKTNFRYKFAKEFSEVTYALKPRVMTIVVDDLDRCKPDQVLKLLEAVNFLTTSGDCYVVLGMDIKRVERFVAFTFKDIAPEFADNDTMHNGSAPSVAALSPEDKAEADRKCRLDYAKHYLEKLVNIEVAVPEMNDEAGQALLQAPPASPPASPWRGVAAIAGRILLTCLVAAVIVGSYYGANVLVPANMLAKTSDAKPSTSPAATASRAASATTPNATGTGTAPTAKPTSTTPNTPGFIEGAQPDKPPYPLLGFILAGLLISGLIGLVREWSRAVETHDSPEFERAMRLWQPLLFTKTKTPRGMKRFVNKVRFLAMRERGDIPETPKWGALGSLGRRLLKFVGDRITEKRRQWGARPRKERKPIFAETRWAKLTAHGLLHFASAAGKTRTWLDTHFPDPAAAKPQQSRTNQSIFRVTAAEERTETQAAEEQKHIPEEILVSLAALQYCYQAEFAEAYEPHGLMLLVQGLPSELRERIIEGRLDKTVIRMAEHLPRFRALSGSVRVRE